MTGTLSHANSQLVTRAQLLTIASPPSTATWRPIAHADLITAIDRQLLVRGITIQSEKFAIQREGARLFAVLDLSVEQSGQFCASMGIRTANDRSQALEIAVGVKVFVCDNLTFSGDLIALRRKHTAKFDLNADISRAVDRYQAHLLALQQQITRVQDTAIGDLEAKALIVDAFRQEIVPIRFFKRRAAGRDHGVALLAEGRLEKLDPETFSGVPYDSFGNVRREALALSRLLKPAGSASLSSRAIEVGIVAKDLGDELRCAPPGGGWTSSIAGGWGTGPRASCSRGDRGDGHYSTSPPRPPGRSGPT